MNIFKKFLFMFSLFVLFAGSCKAESVEYFKQGDLISGAYITREIRGVLNFSQANFILRGSDKRVAYPLDFFAKFNSSKLYTSNDINQEEVLNTTNDNLKRIEALAYFGYLYPSHEDKLWYPVTSKAIMQTIYPVSSFLITDTMRGEHIPKTDDMIVELKNLVSDYFSSNIPSSINIKYGDTKKITLNELKNYKLKGDYDNVILDGDTLLFTGNKFGGDNVILEKGEDDGTIYTTTNDYTKLMVRDTLPKVTKEINLYVSGGNLNIKFKEDEHHYGNCSTEEKNVYGLYKNDDALINTLDVSNNNEFKLEDIEYGSYYVKQISHSCNVKEDNTKYEININKNETTKTITLKDNYKEIQINKKYCDDLKCSNEKDAEFNISDDINNYDVKTNQLGNAYLYLGNGIYKIHQVVGLENYDYSNDLKINLDDYDTDKVTINLTSNIKRGNIVVSILDDNKDPIQNTKVCLYNGNKEVKCVISNNNGKCLFSDIYYGTFSIKETEIDDSYIIDKTKYFLELNSKSNNNITVINKLKEITNDKVIGIDDEVDDLSIEDIPETSVNQNDYIFVIILIINLLYISYRCCKAR